MPRRYLALCGAAILALLFCIWRFGYHGVDPRLILWPPADELAFPAALDEPAEIEVIEAPLAIAALLVEFPRPRWPVVRPFCGRS